MDDILTPPFFITRDMLRFGRAAKLELVITTQVNSGQTLMAHAVTRNAITKVPCPNTNAGNPQTTRIGIDDIPTLVSVVDDTASLQQGQAYATVSLAMNGEIVCQLAAGYVSRQKGISWPISDGQPVIPNRGGLQLHNTGDVIYDTGLSVSIPGGQLMKLLWLTFTLTTSAVAGNRCAHLITDNDTYNGLDIFSGEVQAASLTRQYSFCKMGGIPPTTNNGKIMVAIPDDLYIISNGTFSIDGPNFDADDSFTAITYCVEPLFIV